MKILHTADWHIGQFKGPVVDGVNLRSQDTVKCLEYMVQVAIEEKPDIVCVSGDIFHQEQVGPVRYSDEMITATNIITSLAHFSKHVIVMRGTPNHDGAAQFRVLERMLCLWHGNRRQEWRFFCCTGAECVSVNCLPLLMTTSILRRRPSPLRNLISD